MYQKQESTEPLLQTEKSKAEEKIAYSQVFQNLTTKALMCFFGAMFHPIYSMVNAISLGHEKEI